MNDHEEPVDVEVLETSDEGHAPAVADDVLPDTLYLMPVPNRPFFPGQVQPVAINPQEWGETLKSIGEQGNNLIGLSYVDRGDSSAVEPRQFPEIGCVVRLHRPPVPAEQAGQFLAQGVKRFRIVRWLNDKPPYLVQVEYPRSQGDKESDEIKAYAMALIKEIKELLPLNPLYSEELKQYLGNFSPTQPSLLADFLRRADHCLRRTVAGNPGYACHWCSRIEKGAGRCCAKNVRWQNYRGRSPARLTRQVSDQQREFFLREQMKIIQKELGISKDDRTSDVEMFAAAHRRSRICPRRWPSASMKRCTNCRCWRPVRRSTVLRATTWTGRPQCPGVYHSEDNLELKNAQTGGAQCPSRRTGGCEGTHS